MTLLIFYGFSLILTHSALNLHAMRMGPGKHLKGRILMNGIVTPEEVRLRPLLLGSDLLTVSAIV